MGRALDSRWILGIAVLSVLAAVFWSLHRRKLASIAESTPTVQRPSLPEVELLGVPPGSEVTLDGAKIETLRFGVSAGSRHAVEVRAPDGGVWRQVFRANGPIGLLVELQEPFAEAANPQELGSKEDLADSTEESEPAADDRARTHEAQPRR
jgi:hypothetical protein